MCRFCRPAAWFGGGGELLPKQVERLNQLERLTRRNGLAPGSFFAGSQIGFQAWSGTGKAAANHRSQLQRAHRLTSQPAQAQGLATKSLPGNSYRCGCGSCISIKGAQRFKVLDRSEERRV